MPDLRIYASVKPNYGWITHDGTPLTPEEVRQAVDGAEFLTPAECATDWCVLGFDALARGALCFDTSILADVDYAHTQLVATIYETVPWGETVHLVRADVSDVLDSLLGAQLSRWGSGPMVEADSAATIIALAQDQTEISTIIDETKLPINLAGETIIGLVSDSDIAGQIVYYPNVVHFWTPDMTDTYPTPAAFKPYLLVALNEGGVSMSTVPFTQDVYIASTDGIGTPGNGNAENIAAGHFGTNIFREPIKVDLSSLVGETVVSATLRLYLNTNYGASAGTFAAYRLLKSWIEADVEWDNQSAGVPWETPGAFGVTDCEQTDIGSITLAPDQALGWVEIALDAAAVQEWINGGLPNSGFLLKTTAEADDLKFFDSSTGTNPPEINIWLLSAASSGLAKQLVTIL